MIESPFIKELLEDAEVFQRSSLYQQLQEEMQQGILETLKERFGKVPKDVTAAILARCKPDQWKTLIRATFRCASIEDFRTRLPT